MRRTIGSLVVVVAIAMFSLAGTAAAHTSPEYFWDGWSSSVKIGHRHTLDEVSGRNVSGGGSLCVAGLNDDGSFAGGQIACAGSGAGALCVQPLNGSSWRRGYANPGSGTNFRARETF